MLQAGRLSTMVREINHEGHEAEVRLVLRGLRDLRGGISSFHLAQNAPARLLSERNMHFGARQIAAVLSAAALIFFCACEKHRLGEDPEVQREHVDEGKGENVAAPNKADVPDAAMKSPTPAEFFPKTTPSP